MPRKANRKARTSTVEDNKEPDVVTMYRELFGPSTTESRFALNSERLDRPYFGEVVETRTAYSVGEIPIILR